MSIAQGKCTVNHDDPSALVGLKMDDCDNFFLYIFIANLWSLAEFLEILDRSHFTTLKAVFSVCEF